MRGLIWILLALVPIARASAQTTFFQTPSADVPERAQVRGQLQAAASHEAEFEAMVVLGLGHRLELGLSVYNLALAVPQGGVRLRQSHDDAREPLGPVGVLSAQKLFELSPLFGLSLAAQAGTDMVSPQRAQFVGRAFVLLVLDFDERGRCTAGPYVATHTFVGEGAVWGAAAGCEYELVPHVFGLEVDWDAGSHALGTLSFGPRLHLGVHAALSAGFRIPNAWSSAEWALISQLELTYPGEQD
jgi:hypothetical protein